MFQRLLTIGAFVSIHAIAAAFAGTAPAQADEPQTVGLAVYQAFGRSEPRQSLRRAVRVEACAPSTRPATLPAMQPATRPTAAPARIRLEVPLRTFNLPADVREVAISAPWTGGPFTVTAEGGGRRAGWSLPADAGGGISRWGDWGDVPQADSFPLAITYAPGDEPLKLLIPRAAEHVRFTADSGKIPRRLSVWVGEDVFDWLFMLRFGLRDGAPEDPRKYRVTREVRSVGFEVVRGLREAGLSEEQAEAAVAEACGELAGLSDEALWLEVLAADKEKLVAAERPADAARLGVLFAVEQGPVWPDGLACRMRVGDETLYIAQWDSALPNFEVDAFGPDGKFAWQALVRLTDRKARQFDREGLVRELRALLEPGQQGGAG